MLYQVATGWLSPANIAATLRAILKRHKNTHVLLAEATGIDVDSRRVLLDSGSVSYDSLIVATGSGHHYFGNDHSQDPGASGEIANDTLKHDFPNIDPAKATVWTDCLKDKNYIDKNP